MAIVVTQGANATTAISGSASTTQTFTITPTAVGSFLFITAAISGSAAGCPFVTSVSDNVDGAWKFVQAQSGNANPGNQGAFIAWHENSSSLAARTITVTFNLNGSNLFAKVQVGEATGVAAYNAFDQYARASLGSNGSSVSISPGFTQQFPNELVLGVAGAFSGSAWTAPTTGWTQLWASSNSGTSNDGRAVYQINSAISTIAPTFTETGASALVTGLVASFSDTPSLEPGRVTRPPLMRLGTPVSRLRSAVLNTVTTPSPFVDQTAGWSARRLRLGTPTSLLRSPVLDTGTTAANPNVTLALTGVTGTGSVGTLVPATNTSLTAVVGTGSVGTVTPTFSLSLTGVTGTGSVGTVVPALSLALTAVTGTGAVGTLVPSSSVGLTGTTGTGSAGNLTAALSAALSGASGTGSVGTLIPNIDTQLTGVTGTGSVGTVTYNASGDITLALTGVSATGTSGTLSPATDTALIAVSGTGSAGTLIPGLSLPISGQSASGSVGALSASTSVGLSGVTGSGTAGTVSVQTADVTVALTGVTATGSVGTVIPVGADIPQTSGSNPGGMGGGGGGIAGGKVAFTNDRKRSELELRALEVLARQKAKPEAPEKPQGDISEQVDRGLADAALIARIRIEQDAEADDEEALLMLL